VPDRIRTADTQLGKLTTHQVMCRTSADLRRFRKRPVTWVETVLCRLLALAAHPGRRPGHGLDELDLVGPRRAHVGLYGGRHREAGYTGRQAEGRDTGRQGTLRARPPASCPYGSSMEIRGSRSCAFVARRESSSHASMPADEVCLHPKVVRRQTSVGPTRRAPAASPKFVGRFILAIGELL